MDINELIAIVKKKIESQIVTEEINIEDKSFLHKNHPGKQKDKFHLKISIKSKELSKMSRLDSNKKVYKVLEEELKSQIHSLQLLIS